MDDLSASSVTLEEHNEHMDLLAKTAQAEGFEFKLTKAPSNQKGIQILGCICCAEGRKPALKKVELLESGLDLRTLTICHHV